MSEPFYYVSDFGKHYISAAEWTDPEADVSKCRWVHVDTDGRWFDKRMDTYVRQLWLDGAEFGDEDVLPEVVSFISDEYKDMNPQGFRFEMPKGHFGPFGDGLDLLIGGAA